ncbi:MAG: site-2 protease family protein [Thermoplasmatales archaeon]|nr:site-2 protease family protein [Thermoplasmatales archaeon]
MRAYYSFYEMPAVKPKMSFSKEEIKHLLISIFLLGLAFSIANSFPIHKNFSLFVRLLPFSFLAVLTAFAFHEIAHKYAGIRYGYWSEYRMFPFGLLLAILFSFLGFVFAAPGAVQIFGFPTREQSGKISMAGPLSNILVSALFLAISKVTKIELLILIASINAFLAIFNLIPIPPLDGIKILSWNMPVWVAMLASSAILLFLSFPF